MEVRKLGRNIPVLLVGIGGYGENYVKELLLEKKRDDFELAGVVDPYPEKSRLIGEIKKRNIPIYSTLDEFYECSNADYVCISSPIQYHCEQIIKVLNNSGSVLCEKPLTATVQEGRKIQKALQDTGQIVSIGYQWSFSKAIQSLKKDIIAGELGKPLRFRTMVVWPRGYSYYNRNDWAGRIKDSDGRWILDSVAGNATAHYIHNMFYITGEIIEKSSWPQIIQAELYRANDIENYDTAAARIFTDNGVELLYLATHASDEWVNPRFLYEFEKADVFFDQDKDCRIIARFKDGREKNYGNPYADPFEKIWITMDAVRGKCTYLCGVEAALPHVVCVNGLQEAAGIVNFPEEIIKTGKDKEWNDTVVCVEDIVDVFLDCYDKWKLPSELKAEWANSFGEISLTGYDYFPSKQK